MKLPLTKVHKMEILELLMEYMKVNNKITEQNKYFDNVHFNK